MAFSEWDILQNSKLNLILSFSSVLCKHELVGASSGITAFII